jgi:demethylmenaquinone methyltransferase/2-methoxy-6-polyprenyl-1,4-benzoquinol methylase/phosphoethanolamine N-methyltransferase
MHSPAHRRHAARHAEPPPETAGLLLDLGWRYDLMVGAIDLVTGGRLRALRRRVLDLAGLRPGTAVLDVGCGTGTLAIEAQARVGPAGRVVGVDPAPKQLARARAKAARGRRPIEFRLGVIEVLPFPDASFDAALSTLMMHHLPDDLKARGLAEIARVLKPGGRLVVADAEHVGQAGRPGHFGAGTLGVRGIAGLMQAAGFACSDVVEARLLPLPRFGRVGLVVGTRP